ncbi:MAG: protein kinase [Elusimicrobia bacterium]|nr:protein kinase [Elusimicrobiota bacterium]
MRFLRFLPRLLLASCILVCADDAGAKDGPLSGGPGVAVDDQDVARVDRIADLLHSKDPNKDDLQVIDEVRKELDLIVDREIREYVIREFRLMGILGGNGSSGPPPKPGDSGFPAYVGEKVREDLLPKMKNTSPNSPMVWAENGFMNCAARDYRACLADLGRAISLGSKDPETYATYGSAAHNLGDYKLAIKAANMALDMDPDNAAAHAVLKLSEGRVPTVELPSALEGGAFGAPSGNAAVETPGAGPVPEAVGAPPGREAGASPALLRETRRQITAGEVERSGVYTKQAAAALAVRDYRQAHESASRAIQINIQNAQAWNFRAIANNKLDRYKDAVYDASFALNLTPGNAPALQSRAWALSKTGKYQEALADANYTLEREPDNAFAFQNRAFALAGLGDRAGMMDSLMRSAELDPRFKERYEAALQTPASADILYLFDEDSGSARAVPPSPERRRNRFVMLAAAVVSGGLLMALGFLHIVSASWRERVRVTVRRVLGVPTPSAAEAGGSGPATGFWGQYQLVREVGLGGMGVVYEALDTSLDRRVAIKKMRDEIRLDRRERERFLAEARTVASLRHPNIVEIYSIVEDEGDVYLVFEFASGKTLAAALEESGAFTFDTAKRILKDACEAVDCAHHHKIVHRDVKPSNIMVTEEGTAKVMDFGVARQAKDAATRVTTNTVVGTPPYMAPEAEQGSAVPQSDVYGLGVVFYEMLTGKLPFAGRGAGMLLNKLNGRFPPLSQMVQDLPAGIDDVMARVLAPDPARRHRTAAEFFAALQAL